MTERWCWSLDEERYQGDCSSAEAAFWEALAESEPEDVVPGTMIYLAVARPIVPSRLLPDVGYLIEDVADAACAEFPEYAEGWLEGLQPSDVESLQRAVSAAFDRWCKEHGHEPFFSEVTSCGSEQVTREDFLKVHGPEAGASR
jgi:hypothetical protein